MVTNPTFFLNQINLKETKISGTITLNRILKATVITEDILNEYVPRHIRYESGIAKHIQKLNALAVSRLVYTDIVDGRIR